MGRTVRKMLHDAQVRSDIPNLLGVDLDTDLDTHTLIAVPNRCIEWVGGADNRGYKVIKVEKRRWKAHRWVWTQLYGPIPEGMVVMHTCDNPPCVNPAHLRLGTQRENIDDMVAKGRSPGLDKTHCPQGHEYTPENTRHRAEDGARVCRTCLNEKRRAKRQAT